MCDVHCAVEFERLLIRIHAPAISLCPPHAATAFYPEAVTELNSAHVFQCFHYNVGIAEKYNQQEYDDDDIAEEYNQLEYVDNDNATSGSLPLSRSCHRAQQSVVTI